MTAAVEVQELSKRFRLYRERNQSLKAALMRGKRASFEEFWALRDVSFEIPVGSTFGLIGENGSGKSTMLKCVAQILQPDAGRVVTHGRIAALLELGSGFHQELSGRENVFLNGSILGLTRRELERKFDDIVDFAGIEDFIDQPVKNYSSGMYVRLGFAIAINVDPEILLVDEVLAVGDAAFQEKCMDKFADYRRQGKTVVIVSHAMGSLRSMCDQAIWLEHGRLMRAGKANEIVDDYMDASFSARAGTEVEVIEVAVPTDPEEGTGIARMTSVEMLNADGERRDRFRTGDPVTIRMRFDAPTPIPEANIGYAVDDSHGTHVWSFRTTEGEVELGTLVGTGSLDLVIPALPLQPGSFVLNASIRGANGHLIHRVRAIISFHVDPGHPRESGGLVVFNGRWGNLTTGTTAAVGTDAAPVLDA